MGIDAPTSPFAPSNLPQMPSIPGVRIAATRTGARKTNSKPDLMLAVLDEGTTVAGVLTKSKTRSAPIEWCALGLNQGRARALVVNSGNANAFTGMRGKKAVELTATAAAAAVGCDPSEVFIASTGVIGEPLDTSNFSNLLTKLNDAVAPDNWNSAANAIMTTDTYPKLATVETEIDGTPVNIAGIAKGSGMIAPDMATMLSFIFTDAAIAQPLLQQLVSNHVHTTFNAITVDGDTSTSDTVLVFATGRAKNTLSPAITDASDPRISAFSTALQKIMHDLALAIVKDGEGITKLVTVNVTGAADDKAARTIAFSIANSPLVKTAIAGSDPNWGRVVMAVGKSGEHADRDKLAIWFGPHTVAHQGERARGYDEETTASYMQNSEITIRVDVGVGSGTSTVWTCDLTHGYITINADYRS